MVVRVKELKKYTFVFYLDYTFMLVWTFIFWLLDETYNKFGELFIFIFLSCMCNGHWPHEKK